MTFCHQGGNMKRLVLACCISLMVPFLANAAAKQKVVANKAILKALVADFYFEKSMKTLSQKSISTRSASSFKIRCDDEEVPDKSGCVEAVCSKLASYECNDVSDLKEIAAMCGNNVDGSCVTETCSKLPSYECNDKADMKQVAKMCASQVDGECMKSVCSKLPSYECNDKADMDGVAKMCSGLVDGSCVDAVCSKLPSYECNDKADLANVIQMCKNP